MTTDDLTRPLGQHRPKHRRLKLPFGGRQAVVVVLGLILIAFLAVALFHRDPLGGEPMVRLRLELPKTAEVKPDASKDSAVATTPATQGTDDAGKRTVTIIDGSSGARQSVTVPAGDTGDGAARDGGEKGASETIAVAAIDPRLLESGRYGPIPIIAEGIKPMRAYAAGSDGLRAKAATMPAIAVVVGGFGIGVKRSQDSIARLPAGITLAFMPYGNETPAMVSAARARGHEILLQIPMEPFDYPDNDPGPQTLLASLNATQNVDRLHWHLSRFPGYVGIANFMGAKFMTNDAAVAPVMREASKRGLLFLDDGSITRTLASQSAEVHTVPFARSDLTIDALPNAIEIDRALSRLEGIAKQRGFAVGYASLLPITVDRIAGWSKALESRGLLLVPLTTVIAKSRAH